MRLLHLSFVHLSFATLAAILSFGMSSQTLAGVKNIVLVHSLNVDGSGWHAVYDILAARDYRVSIVPSPPDGYNHALDDPRKGMTAFVGKPTPQFRSC